MDPNSLDKEQTTTPEAVPASPVGNIADNGATAPVSPLQAITEPEVESGQSTVESPEVAPTATPQVQAPVEKKKSKTTMYLLIVLGVLVIAAAGLFIYTIL